MLGDCNDVSYLGLTDYDGNGTPDLLVVENQTGTVVEDPGSGTNGWLTANPTTIISGW